MTNVTQTKPPLTLSRVEDKAIHPPSYLMEPADMGVDLYEPHPNGADETPSGLIRRAPYQNGHWVIHPSYSRALPYVIDTQLKKIWTRCHQPGSDSGWYSEAMMRSLSSFEIPDEVRWLHCLRVAAKPTNLLSYTAIVVDFLHPTMPHDSRREILEKTFPILGFRTLPDAGKMVLVPEYPVAAAEDLWAGLHLMNGEWKVGLYDGLIMKQDHIKYTYQMDDRQRKTMRWQLHKFSDIYPQSDEA